MTTPASIESVGFCTTCKKEHRLGTGNSLIAAKELMATLERTKNINIFTSTSKEDTRFSTTPLFGPDRGKMFGVMECCNKRGETSFYYAFSGQFNGYWLVPGWIPPIFSLEAFNQLTTPIERKIKTLGAKIDNEPLQSNYRLELQRNRRALSRRLMQNIHKLYHFSNFRGETALLKKAFTGKTGIPTGTGDCCAPKLLHYAASHGLRPLGICEFFWGRETKSQSYHHQEFSAPCRDKCLPILGFLLCGLSDIAE